MLPIYKYNKLKLQNALTDAWKAGWSYSGETARGQIAAATGIDPGPTVKYGGTGGRGGKRGTPSVTITDIQIGSSGDGYTRFLNNEGELDKNALQIAKFPPDMEGRNLPYMLFTIFDSQIGAVNSVSNVDTSIRSGAQKAAETGKKVGEVVTGDLQEYIVTGVNKIVNGAGQLAGFGNAADKIKTNFTNFALNRNTVQSTAAIALYMPDDIRTSYMNEYENMSLTSKLGLAGFATQAIASKKGNTDETDPYLMEGLTRALSAAGVPGLSEASDLLLYTTTGRSLNPQFETLYKAPSLRQFVFNFTLIPKNQNEAWQIQTIIQRFKRAAAPIMNGESTGRYFIPPSRFEIEFHHKNERNEWLFKIQQCVLQDITVDYSPGQYATHTDGSPVETRLSLTFQETIIVDRDKVDEGY
jgi:hypothetical protein